MMENCESEIIDLCFDMGDDELLELEADDLVMEDNITSGTSASDRLREHKDGIDNDMGIALDGIDFDEEMEEEDAANISVGLDSAASHVASDEIGQSSGFDFTTGRLWIYPTNYPVRDYQYNIVQQALYKNTLVVLPTGLGKTFIAAVVMYNLYRWFPQGKIVFMAPTKPLVAQQIHACYNIMGIPKADTIEMTGTMPPAARQKAWKEKRVVFLTPQVMTNDLSRGSCTADSVKCLVVDEAHKALGNHAYCQVVRELVKFTRAFRVLALSATPGGDLKAVQQVMNNLLISHIELRSEESIDIRPYTHERKVDKVVVPMGEELKGVRLQYIQIMTCVIQRLIRNRVLYNREATKLSKFLILKARDEFRQNPPQNMQQIQYGNIEADFALAMSLYHGFELLQLHGLRSLYNFLMGIIAGEKGYGRTRSELMRNADFNSIMETLRQKFSAAPNLGTSSIDGNKIVVGHPKMQRLEEIVVEHFQTFQKRGDETRVMIFSQYRDSVQEISAILNQHEPLVKVMPFIGQSSVGKATKGYTQKEQLKVMREFRQGGYNTLVSTCVGEEGLDIGDVDLIVCFDAHKSPIRLVQRMGRTGRKRQGRIVMLVTEGKEEQIYNQSVYSKKSIHKAILNGARSLHFYPNNPRLVPSSIHPECHKMYITVATTDTVKKKETASNSSKSTAGSRNRKISDVFGKQAKRPADDGMLTLAEFEEIQHEFSQVPAVAKCLPKPKCITLTSEREAVENKSSSSVISLSEWMPWQNRLQGTRLVGHSIQSQHLVKIAEFMEIQNCIGEEEDTYGIEMRTFLNKEDIFEGDTTVGQSSIVSFLAPVEDHSHTKEKSSVRDEEQSIIVNSDSSSEELPAGFDQVSESLKCKSSKLFTEIKNSKNKSSLSNSVKKILKKSTKSLSKSQTRKGKKFLPGSQTSVRKSQLAKETLSKKSKSIAKKGQSDVLTGRKTKSISKLFAASTSDLPCSKDSDDFDTNMIGGTCHEALSMHEVCEVEGDEINCSAVDANNHVNDIMYDDTSQEASGEISSSVAAMKTELGNEFDERSATESGEAVTECRERIHIPTPPPVSEVRELFSNPNLVLDFAAIQLDDLVEEWKRSDEEECTAFKAKHHELMLGDKACASSCTHRSAVKPLTNTICDSTLLRQKSNLAKRSDHKTDKAVLDFGDDGTDVSDTKKPCLSKSGSSPCTILAENHSNANKSGSCAKKSNTPSSPKSPAIKSLTSIMAERKTPKVRKSITFNEPNLQDLESEKNINRSHQKSMERDRNKELQNSVNTKMNLSVSNSEMKCGAAAQKSLPQIIENMNQNNMFDFDLSLDMDFDVDTYAHMHSKTSDTPSTSTGKSKEHSESFVTFTQALECLQTSSSESYTENIMEECSTPNHSLSKSEKFFKETVKKCAYAEGNKVSDNDSAPKHIISPDKDSHSNLCSPISKGNALHPSVHGAGFTTPVKQQDTCHDDLDLPQFDLGFDLEDDIIPPTPPKDTSQTSSVSDVLMQTSQKRLTDEFSAFVSQKKHQVSQSSHSNADVPQENQFEDEEEIIKALSNDEVNNDEWLLNNDSDIELEPNTEMEAGEKSIIKHLPEASAVTHTVKLTDVNNENIGMRRDRVHFAESLLVSSTSEKVKSSAQTGEARRTVSSFSHHHQKISVSGGTSNNLSQDFEGNGNESVLKDKKYIAPDFRNKSSSGQCSPSPPKRKKLPFDRYCESSEVNDVPYDSNACNVEHQDKGNIAHGNTEHQDKGNPAPGNTVKSKTGKLRLGKRRQCITGTDRTSKISTTSADTSDSSTAHEKYKNVDQLVDGDRKREEDKNKNITEYKKQDSMSKSRLELVLPDFSLQADCKDEDSVLTERKMLKASTPIRPILGEIHNSRVAANDDDDLENLTPIKELHMTVNDEEKYDSEESFFIRRRKKPATALNVSSDQDASMKDVSSKSSSKASTDRSSSKQSNSSTDERKSKSVSYDRHHLSLVEEFDDMEDFEDDASNLVHRKPVLREEEQVGKKKRKKKSKGTEFIDKEAEVSGDDELSSDEHEGMDDYYECSFVDDNTEMTQANDTDMRAVYLKSVKSPPVAGYAGRYKLHGHRNEYRDVDIYSQALPEDQGMSEYEEDSFCVDDDEEAISYVEEESSFEETTKGRRKAKDNGRKSGNSKKTLGKRRIKRISDSSSDEEEGNRLPATQEFTAPQPIPGRRILLSSSEDEWDKKSSGHPRQKSTNEKCSSESDSIHSKHSSESKASDFGNFSMTNKRNTIANQDVSNVGITSVTRDKNMTKIKDVHNDPSRKQDTQSEKMLEPGNFNLLDDDDWFADFDVPIGNDTSREMATKSLSSGEAKTKSPFNKFLSLKSKGKNESSYVIDCENEKHIPIRDKEESFGNLKTSVKHGGSSSGTTSICQVAPIIISSQDDQYSENIQAVNYTNNPHNTFQVRSVSENKFQVHNNEDHRSSQNPGALHSSQKNLDFTKPAVAMTREERLRKQKEKQEKFRQKLAQVERMKKSANSSESDTLESVNKGRLPTETADNAMTTAGGDSTSINCDLEPASESKISPVFTKIVASNRSEEQLQILVDSREISGAQEIISSLRLKHGINVTAWQLSSCDYILSNHLAADRVNWSTFSNSSNRNKISQRLCEMQALYDRCVLIVEADRVKPGQEKNRKPVHHTKYLDTTLSYIAQSRVKLYFTDNVEETSALLSDLCHVEGRKGRALTVSTSLLPKKQEMLNFLLSFPKMTVPQALNLTQRFRSVAEMIASPATVIQERGCMSLNAAQAVYKFLRHQFDIQMMPNSKR